MSLAKNMPLLGEFACYVDWETDAKRWAKMLYNHPISVGVYYFINNLKDDKGSLMDKNAVGFLKRKLESKVEENEKSIPK